MEQIDELETKRSEGLEEVAKVELAEIIATANEHGFAANEVLDALSVAVDAAREALNEDPDPAEDPPADACELPNEDLTFGT